MLAERYSKDKLNTNIERRCFSCKGKGSIASNESNKEDICYICKGSGKIEVELELCPQCNQVVPRDNEIWINDSYGIPYKKVCFDCVDKTKREIENWRFNNSYGERLEVDY